MPEDEIMQADFTELRLRRDPRASPMLASEEPAEGETMVIFAGKLFKGEVEAEK